METVFTDALEQEVDVELVHAIGRGDECCEFLLQLTGAGGQH